MKVVFSKYFTDQYEELTDGIKGILDNFFESVYKYDLTGLPGRNKKSDNTNPNWHYHKRDEKLAQDNFLWHYHIGIPSYDTSKGFSKYISDAIIHYQRFPDKSRIKIVAYSENHNPFILPTEDMLEHKKIKLYM